MDEVHINIQHGISFRGEIRALRVEFFQRVHGNQPIDRQPRLIALTATFTRSYVPMLSNLMTVDFSISQCILRGSILEFQQPEIKMRLEMCSAKAQFVGKGLSHVAEFLQRNRDSSVVIFCNSRKQSQHVAIQLEKKLDLMKLSVDVVNINGALDKNNKFMGIRLFSDDRHSCQGKFRALVTTNASNVGIDKHSLALQVRFEWPCDLLTYFQERGRGSKLQGANSTCIVYGDLSSYVYLRSQLFAAGNNDDDASPSTDECDEYNSAILPRKNSHGQPITKKTYPLGPTGRRCLRERTTIKLQEVLSFFCLDLGCQHARGESYLATGILNTTCGLIICIVLDR